MDQKIIKEYIRALEHMTGFLRTLLEEEMKMPPLPEGEREKLSEFTSLRMLAKSEKWPLAVPEDLICGDDEDHKLARAAGIVNEFIRTDLTDKKLLDFGCGEGHVPYIAANLIGVKSAVGYDLVQEWDKIESIPNLQFTSDFNVVKENGPYDVILINDVLDHNTDPDMMKKVKSIKTETGRIYMRCHPWTSRHGTHLYKQLNRAYLHLVFTEDELYAMGLKETKATILLDPLETYRKMISEAGLKVLNEDHIKHPVEIFFTHEEAVLRRIKEKWATSKNPSLAKGKTFPRDILEIQFADFVLI